MKLIRIIQQLLRFQQGFTKLFAEAVERGMQVTAEEIM